MKATLHFVSGDVENDLTAGVDLSTRLEFSGQQPSAFELPRAWAEPFRAGTFVGDTREGGSVNCATVTLNPHGNGTHTECVGHIVDDRIHVSDILQDVFSKALVISVHPEPIGTSNENYDAQHSDDDIVVSSKSLSKAIKDLDLVGWALIIRTLPNPESKRHAHFSGNQPVYFTREAMLLIYQAGVKHLLVDFPSVDREDDGGLLPNHHVFWDIPAGTHSIFNVPSSNTITEMIYVPESILDGVGAVTIQIPDFAMDAAPSRPRYFKA